MGYNIKKIKTKKKSLKKMVHEKANKVVEQLYDAILGSLASWRKDSEKDEDLQVSFLDKQIVISSAIDAFAQLVSVDIGLAKK